MKLILHLFFILLLLTGIGILVFGIMINYNPGTGIAKSFHNFFNDNPLGWVIMFGSMIIGFIGATLTVPQGSGHYSSGAYSNSTSSNNYDSDNYDSSDSDTYSSNNGRRISSNNGHYYDDDGRELGYTIDNTHYNSSGAEVGYDIGDHHYDQYGASKGYRIDDREYDEDGRWIGSWNGDTFYKN